MNQPPDIKPIIVKRNLKHTFTTEETTALSTEFRQAYQTLKSVEAEFDSVKAVWKAKITEAGARMETLNTTLSAGFEMRLLECEVRLRPLDKKKDFYLLPATPEGEPKLVATEDMTPDDFAQDLIRAESVFSLKTELELWAAGNDYGKLIVGQLNDRWYSAIRARIGAVALDERLDSEQRSYKERFDAVQRAGKRCLEWVDETLGKEAAKGFCEPVKTKIEAERGKAE